jgi:hypothetical protein
MGGADVVFLAEAGECAERVKREGRSGAKVHDIPDFARR